MYGRLWKVWRCSGERSNLHVDRVSSYVCREYRNNLYIYLQETIMNPLASSLQHSLLTVMPELESVRVICASPFESPTIEESIDKIAKYSTLISY